MTYSVAIAGASGYAGGEVLRLLAGRAEFSVSTVIAQGKKGVMRTVSKNSKVAPGAENV
jgi:N-acetyl-gamma-glutamylphosphate reductase